MTALTEDFDKYLRKSTTPEFQGITKPEIMEENAKIAEDIGQKAFEADQYIRKNPPTGLKRHVARVGSRFAEKIWHSKPSYSHGWFKSSCWGVWLLGARGN